MSETALIAAFRLDGQGGGEEMDWTRLAAKGLAEGQFWVHLYRDHPDSRAWLEGPSGLDPLVVEALLAENTRPRCEPIQDGVMLFLRGVNLNPGADPEDMVSIRLWIEPTRIVSAQLRRLLSVDDVCNALRHGRGPLAVGDLVLELVQQLGQRIGDVLGDIDDAVDRLQAEVLQSGNIKLRGELNRLRHEIITLRRYLAPQRDALARLAQAKVAWLDDDERLHLREQADRVTRYVEDLDEARDRAALTQEELSNRLSEQMNARMYVLSVVAAVFLPLGFLTGLFGINVGGIPLADSPLGFWEVSIALVAVVLIQLVIFRWRRWF
jgi:zinc transporter